MSWADWVTGYVIHHTEPSGEQVYYICRRGAITDHNGAAWGAVQFEFQNYDLTIKDEEDKDVKGAVNEWANFIDAWANKGRTKKFGGLRFNNERFTLSKFDEDEETMYLTGLKSGCCIAKSDKTFVFGVYYNVEGEKLTTSLGKERNYSAGNAIGAVMNCREKLREAGY